MLMKTEYDRDVFLCQRSKFGASWDKSWFDPQVKIPYHTGTLLLLRSATFLSNFSHDVLGCL